MIGKKNGKVVQAFTIQHDGKAREIISDAGVSEPFELDKSNRFANRWRQIYTATRH